MSNRPVPDPQPPLAFAFGGAAGQERPNTLAAFALALRLGATGLASGLWATADGVPVLAQESTIRRGFRRRSIASMQSDALPDDVVTLDRLYRELGSDYTLALAVGDESAVDAAVAVAGAREQLCGGEVASHLWLSHRDWEYLARQREVFSRVCLVSTARLHRLPDGPERRAAQLGAAGIDVMAMLHGDWTRGLVVLFDRFGVRSMALSAEHDRHLDDVLAMGVHAASSVHPDRLADALNRAGW